MAVELREPIHYVYEFCAASRDTAAPISHIKPSLHSVLISHPTEGEG